MAAVSVCMVVCVIRLLISLKQDGAVFIFDVAVLLDLFGVRSWCAVAVKGNSSLAMCFIDFIVIREYKVSADPCACF